jgi:hypothetical protein
LWHYPEAFGGANEFRSLRCCGQVLLTASSSLHRRKIDFPTFRNLAGKTIDHGVISQGRNDTLAQARPARRLRAGVRT